MISTDYKIKLCDFGSATTIVYEPDNTWSVNKRNLIEDEIAKQTTPMYRAPEMLDLYNNYKIDKQCDIWALGCVLYLLCFNKHPFEDAAKLRIINGKYTIPANDKEFTDFHDLLRTTLNIDPSQRPSIDEILFHLENTAQTLSVNLQENLTFLKKTEALLNNSNGAPTSINQNVNNNLPQSYNAPNQAAGAGGNWMGNASNILKGGNSFFKSIKEASSKVIDSVQQ